MDQDEFQKDEFQKRLTELEEKWFNKTITPEEAEEYSAWYNADQDKPVDIPAAFAASEKDHEGKMLKKIRQNTFGRSNLSVSYIIRWASVAAAILLAVTAGFFFLNDKQNDTTKSDTPVLAPVTNDVLPGKTGATLTLTDGKVIVLDGLNNGKIANQSSVIISLENGRIVYEKPTGSKPETVFHTLTTPHGRQFELELNDGTKVWLNSSSSIKFPVVFAQHERQVEVSGEAYFEVKKNPLAPFVVKVNKQEVQVLGTHFNIMAYPDEDHLATTLVEGAVIFKDDDRKIRLQPGQQSRFYKNGSLQKSNVSTNEYTAWKSGFFYFRGSSIESVMRQLQRWYDIEVEYKTDPGEEEFYAEIRKDNKLSDILKALEFTGKVHFSVINNKVIVGP